MKFLFLLLPLRQTAWHGIGTISSLISYEIAMELH